MAKVVIKLQDCVGVPVRAGQDIGVAVYHKETLLCFMLGSEAYSDDYKLIPLVASTEIEVSRAQYRMFTQAPSTLPLGRA